MSEIPVNTRVIGEPKGEVIFYFEDYVYTFMKRIQSECRRQDCEVEFYGMKTYHNGVEIFIVSGAIHIQKGQSRQEHFSKHTLLGKGWIDKGIENDICINLVTQDKRKIEKEDFYIYYAQNEEMQNYLIEWNQEHYGMKNRAENNDSVRYSRIIQNHNKEEVKISFLWNVMNVLGLSFIICVMVYAIVSMNHYYKMKDMEENLAYVISVISDSVKLQDVNSISGILETKVEEETLEQKEYITEEILENIETTTIEEGEKQATEEIKKEETQALVQSLNEQDVQPAVENNAVQIEKTTQMSENKEYIVQDGDTLRSIAYKHYGDYEMVHLICIKNEITNPNNILSGQKLLLP